MFYLLFQLYMDSESFSVPVSNDTEMASALAHFDKAFIQSWLQVPSSYLSDTSKRATKADIIRLRDAFWKPVDKNKSS